MSPAVVRFGVTLPWFGPEFRPEEILGVAKVGEERGFDSLWSGDHLLHFPGFVTPEAWTLLTASSVVTTKARLGTCVTDPHRHHPAVMAQRLATIDHFAGGRVILGLGAGDAINLDPFNIDWKRPVSKLLEFVEIMRRLWAGEAFSHQGEFWSFQNAFLQIKPLQARLPIYFAANGPRMLRLTGELADGWLPLGLTPGMYKKRLDVIKESAAKAGRDVNDIDAGLYIGMSIADKAEDAYSQLQQFKPMLVPAVLKEADYKVDLPEKLRSYSYMDWKPTNECMELLAEYGKHVPDEAVMDFCIGGTPEECVDKIKKFIGAGVQHFVFEIVGPDHRGMVERIGKEITPCFAD
jgi:alkanesulfonate monooxygenase SsuD/methylene tetrahydromethanopterin reductase-like flavin-dependent oxidoreductase (luciferase family)